MSADDPTVANHAEFNAGVALLGDLRVEHDDRPEHGACAPLQRASGQAFGGGIDDQAIGDQHLPTST
jgi:hypothetical protein